MRSAVSVFTVLTLFVPVGAGAGQFINLVVGQSRMLQVEGASSVAVGDSTVVDVKVLPGGNEVMLTGLQPGVTNIIVLRKGKRKKEYTVRVLSSDPHAIAGAVREALAGVEGVRVRVAGAQVILEGEVLRKEDEELIDHVLKAFPGVISFVRKRRVLPEFMVQIDVKLVEISESSFRDIGFAWPGIFGGDMSFSYGLLKEAGAGWSSSVELAVVSNLSASLRLLWQTGAVRILSNPVLVTRSGERARFLAGGEIPIPTAGALGQVDVEYKEFGVLLEFTPRADAYGNVALDVHVEVSDVDYSNAVDAGGFRIPAIRKRSASSKVNLREGESLAIAEIFTESWRKNVSKLPFLGHIPIIGELFKSRQFQGGKSRFMAFVTPQILRPGALPAERIRKMLDEYERWRKKVSGSVLD